MTVFAIVFRHELGYLFQHLLYLVAKVFDAQRETPEFGIYTLHCFDNDAHSSLGWFFVHLLYSYRPLGYRALWLHGQGALLFR